MNYKIIYLFILSFGGYQGTAQEMIQVETTVKNHTESLLYLHEYEDLKTKKIDSIITDINGYAKFTIPKKTARGLALTTENKTSTFFFVNQESVSFTIDSIGDYVSLNWQKGKSNILYANFLKAKELSLPKMDLIEWLLKQYDPQSTFCKDLEKEKIALKEEETKQLSLLMEDKYVVKHINWQLLLRDIYQTFANKKIAAVPGLLKRFEKVDFSDKDFQESGLMLFFIEDYFTFLEHFAPEEIIKTTDLILDQFVGDEQLTNQFSEMMLRRFEEQALVDAATHLSLRLLADNTCQLEDNLARNLEQYRKLKVGNIAPDLEELTADSKFPLIFPSSTNYKLVTFWSNDCSHCALEIPRLERVYPILKENDIEVVSIFLDSDKAAFQTLTKNHPWVSYSDFQRWDGPIAKAYSIYSTPSFFLLDKENRIILKPISAAHIKAYTNQFMN